MAQKVTKKSDKEALRKRRKRDRLIFSLLLTIQSLH